MASQNKQKKNKNANLWGGSKGSLKVKRISFYNSTQRQKLKNLTKEVNML